MFYAKRAYRHLMFFSRVYHPELDTCTATAEQNPYKELVETINRTGIRYINGVVETRNPEMDGKWNAAMFFFPANEISDAQIKIVEGRLKELMTSGKKVVK
jgi:hypothetical protein